MNHEKALPLILRVICRLERRILPPLTAWCRRWQYGCVVQEDEYIEIAGVGGEQKVTGNVEEGRFSAVVGVESGLKTFKEVVIIIEMGFELACNGAFDELGQEWKFRDRSVICSVRVKSRFFKYGVDGGEPE